MKKRSHYRMVYALVAWIVLLTLAALTLTPTDPGLRSDPKLAIGVIGCTLVLSAYTLLALAINLQDQARAIKAADNPTARRIWLAFQLLLITLAATAIIWSAWPK